MNDDDGEPMDGMLKRLERTMIATAGLSPILRGGRYTPDGLPISDGVTSGYAISAIINSAVMRIRGGRVWLPPRPVSRWYVPLAYLTLALRRPTHMEIAIVAVGFFLGWCAGMTNWLDLEREVELWSRWWSGLR